MSEKLTDEQNAKLYEALTGQAVEDYPVPGNWVAILDHDPDCNPVLAHPYLTCKIVSRERVPPLSAHENFATIVRPGMREKGWRYRMRETKNGNVQLAWYKESINSADRHETQVAVDPDAETTVACTLALKALEA